MPSSWNKAFQPGGWTTQAKRQKSSQVDLSAYRHRANSSASTGDGAIYHQQGPGRGEVTCEAKRFCGSDRNLRIFPFQDPTQWLRLAGRAFQWLNYSSVWARRQTPQISIQASHLMALWASPDNHLEFMLHSFNHLHLPARLPSLRGSWGDKCQQILSKGKGILGKNQVLGNLRLTRKCETVRLIRPSKPRLQKSGVTGQCGVQRGSGGTSSCWNRANF